MLNLFISYATEDTAFKNAFVNHLSGLRRSGKIAIWSDSEISPGATWDTVTKAELHRADIIFLLVSNSFLAADHIWNNELRESLERRNNGEAVVLIPILLRPCVIKNTVLEAIQGLPRNHVSVTQHRLQDEAWYQIVQEVHELIIDFPNYIESNSRKSASVLSSEAQTIIGNKNIISGSVIIVGGNLHVGDVDSRL